MRRWLGFGSDPSLERIRIRCPDCGGTFRIRPTMIGRSGPCARCGSSFTATRELVVSGARDRSGGPVGSRAADHGQQGPGRRNRGYRPALPEAVPLQLLLRPPVAVVFVPGCFLIGLFLWINAWTESEHFESSGRAVMYLWWILYPAIGYYLSIGWVAAGMGTSRQARFLGTNVLLVVSDAFVAMSSFFMILFASMFRVSRKGIRDLCKLWGMLNAAIIRGASRAVGRLVSATLLPAPLVAWALCTRNRPLGTPGNFALHVAGLLPGMIVLGLFLAPLSEQARYQQKSAQVQAAGAIPGQPSHPQAASKVAGPESDLTAGDPSQGIWTGNWQLSYDKAKLTLEQRGSSATGAVQVSFGGPIEGTARGDALSGVCIAATAWARHHLNSTWSVMAGPSRAGFATTRGIRRRCGVPALRPASLWRKPKGVWNSPPGALGRCSRSPKPAIAAAQP